LLETIFLLLIVNYEIPKLVLDGTPKKSNLGPGKTGKIFGLENRGARRNIENDSFSPFTCSIFLRQQ
jgi:hypothetical protein